MLKRKLLLLLIICLPIILISQDQNFVVEEHGQLLEVVIPNPLLSIHYPHGLIYRDTAYNYMSNIQSGRMTLANGPFGAESVANPYDRVSLDYNSIEFHKNISERVGSWGPRSEGSSNYDLETRGTVKSLATDGRIFSELTNGIGEGLVKVYRYNLNPNIDPLIGTLSVDGFKAVSDRRLKHNIAPMQSLLPKVLSLRPSTYVYNGFEKSSLGFIAQEVQEVFPELVSEIDGNLAVNYSAFSTLAIQAIKEQQETISTLTAQVQAFESRLTSLEKNE